MAYDANGNVTRRTDFNNNVTTYSYDLSRNLETSRTEASGTSVARTINTTWHPTFRLPLQISEPGRTTAFSYDSSGNLTRKTVTDTASSQTQAWAYTYNGSGQIVAIDGPRTDVADLITYSYYTSTSEDYRIGDVASIQNTLGHVTQITAYDAHGRPLTIVDPNGLVTTLTYDLRSRLTSRTAGDLTTSYIYDGAGQLTQVTLPNSAYLMFTYDAAHRVTDIQEQLGNHIYYTLDLMGNRVKEDVYDSAGVR